VTTPAPAALPKAKWDIGREIALEYFPRRFHRLGGSWCHPPAGFYVRSVSPRTYVVAS